tara:strand:- start:81 stop:521 length:441 start_codon:yes stop_codon:yes gene_type:complete
VGIKRSKLFRGAKGSAENVEFSATVNEDVSVGSILAFFPDGLFGQVRKARVETNQVIGISLEAAKQSQDTTVVQEGLTKVKMDAVPATGDNGKPVYLSQNTNGVASLTAPTASGNNVIKIGYLYGADGVTSIPDVVLGFQFIVYLG